MGKKEKEHRMRVAKRNARIQQSKNVFDKAYKSVMEGKMAELKEKFANLSEDEVNVALNNNVIDATIVEPIPAN
jgi:hypothetical protein